MTAAVSERQCAGCGRDPAEGFAEIDGKFYCHGDTADGLTCYMRATVITAVLREHSETLRLLADD